MRYEMPADPVSDSFVKISIDKNAHAVVEAQ